MDLCATGIPGRQFCVEGRGGDILTFLAPSAVGLAPDHLWLYSSAPRRVTDSTAPNGVALAGIMSVP